jgi:di- and tripeptidase
MSTPYSPLTVLTSSSAVGGNGNHLENEDDVDAVAERPLTPSLSHRLKHDKSILALAVSSKCIFAGTEGGEILVR